MRRELYGLFVCPKLSKPVWEALKQLKERLNLDNRQVVSMGVLMVTEMLESKQEESVKTWIYQNRLRLGP